MNETWNLNDLAEMVGETPQGIRTLIVEVNASAVQSGMAPPGTINGDTIAINANFLSSLRAFLDEDGRT